MCSVHTKPVTPWPPLKQCAGLHCSVTFALTTSAAAEFLTSDNLMNQKCHRLFLAAQQAAVFIGLSRTCVTGCQKHAEAALSAETERESPRCSRRSHFDSAVWGSSQLVNDVCTASLTYPGFLSWLDKTRNPRPKYRVSWRWLWSFSVSQALHPVLSVLTLKMVPIIRWWW